MVEVIVLWSSIPWTLVLGALRSPERWMHLVLILVPDMATRLVPVTVRIVRTSCTPCLVLWWKVVCILLGAARFVP